MLAIDINCMLIRKRGNSTSRKWSLTIRKTEKVAGII